MRMSDMTESERARLLRYRAWNIDTVIPGFQRQLDAALAKGDNGTQWRQSIARCLQHVANIDWQLATDPPRKVPTCGRGGLYSEHNFQTCPQCNPEGRKSNNPYGKRGKPKFEVAGINTQDNTETNSEDALTRYETGNQ